MDLGFPPDFYGEGFKASVEKKKTTMGSEIVDVT